MFCWRGCEESGVSVDEREISRESGKKSKDNRTYGLRTDNTDIVFMRLLCVQRDIYQKPVKGERIEPKSTS
jgi:hypothetical protein